jgi:hypothetical protein
MDDGSPGSREAEGEGGEGFYIAQTGRRADLQEGGGKGGGPEQADSRGIWGWQSPTRALRL